MRLKHDLTGKSFGKLRALEHVPGGWRVRCRCGTVKVVSAGNLLAGRVQSCGCLRRPKPKNGKWFCTRCRHWFTKKNFPIWNKKPMSRCRQCSMKVTMATRDPETKREYNRIWMKGYSKRPEVRERARLRPVDQQSKEVCARRELNYAVRRGELKRPKVCPVCRDPKEKVHGHHDDYNKPLEVEWMCSRCHGKQHRKAA